MIKLRGVKLQLVPFLLHEIVIFGKKGVTCNLLVTTQTVDMTDFILLKLQLQFIYIKYIYLKTTTKRVPI